MLDSPNGHVYSLCRCIWYRAPWTIMLSALFMGWIERVEMRLQLFFHKLHNFYNNTLPMLQFAQRLSRKMFMFMWLKRNPYYWASSIVKRYTDLQERNPGLNLWRPQSVLMRCRFILYKPIILVRSARKAEDTWSSLAAKGACEIGMPVLVVLVARCTGFDRGCNNKRGTRILP